VKDQGSHELALEYGAQRACFKCVRFIRGPLMHIYNTSLKSGKFPEKFKIAKLKPLYKKEDIHNAEN
jgi:hypothetical protein